ncbi:MAG: hypothetical protein D6721_05675 [Gammaproteobacteria bacterium]|nr:MAG: hypothetical protein D6721_05675 [Gammaproteobacteria bacterium]
MHRRALEIELLEDAVFSARAATEGGHETLDRIPGAALLGAAAGRLYAELELGTEAFTVFHSGRLRFGDGLPLSASGRVGWPVPLAWHYPKNTRIEDEPGRFRPEVLFNFQHQKTLPTRNGRSQQPKQLRQGYVTASGEWLRPTHDLRLKTAIDPVTGRAAEGQLFGYDALHRGQRFRAWVEADADLDAALFERVVEALTGEVLLGRSRSAEYGRARITPISNDTRPAPGPAHEGHLTLWLLSDLALADAHGQPTLQPAPEHFGLKGGRILWERTFLRTRRYSPWNAARGGFDRERLVVVAGSVITLEPPPDYDREALRRRLEPGIGLYREAGLGRIWLDPPLLAGEQPRFEPTETAEQPAAGMPGRPSHPLVDWLMKQDIGWKEAAEQAARDFEEKYLERLAAARRLAGIPSSVDFGPSRSQWGSVLQKAKGGDAQTAEALHRALFDPTNGVIKEQGEGWNIEVRVERAYRPLAAWLRERLRPGTDGIPADARGYAHFLRTAARRIQDDIQRRRA